MAKSCGLHRRWIRNTVAVVVPLAVVCVLVVTAVFAVYYYSDMEADLHYRAEASSSVRATPKDAKPPPHNASFSSPCTIPSPR